MGPPEQSRSLLRYVLIVYCIDLETTGEYAFRPFRPIAITRN